MHAAINFVAIGSLALIVAACDSGKDANKSNFSKVIQNYLDTHNGLCAAIPAKRLPFTLADQDAQGQHNKKRADALVEAGLLSKRGTEGAALFGNKAEPATEYQVTEYGKKFLVTTGTNMRFHREAFCTGKYTIVDIDFFTEPADMMGVRISQVNYRYKVDRADGWAKSKGVLASYKTFAEQAQEELQGELTVVLTKYGWRPFNH